MKPKYKHMSPYEVLLWDAHLAREAGPEWEFFYDVRVGEGSVLPGVTAPEFVEAGRLLTQKRIDAVGRRPGEIWIYEVKPDAGLSALGQVLAYHDLYQRQFLPREPIRLAVVTDYTNPDERYLFARRGVAVYTYPEVAIRWEREHG